MQFHFFGRISPEPSEAFERGNLRSPILLMALYLLFSLFYSISALITIHIYI